ncbi:MAG: LysR family transcriptional regulator [Methanosphaera sp.]|nr:LysR family transcriptional regulator [Methanosphaera sp.]
MVEDKKLNYEVNDILFDYKLFDTLKAINIHKSQRKAANSLNIAHTVLNRRILQAEELLDKKLVLVSNRGSVLTDYALDLLSDYELYEERLKDDDVVTISGGFVSCEFLRQLAMAYHIDVRILQTDMQSAIKLTNQGMVDILSFDDPVRAYMMNLEPVPLARDNLLLLSDKKEKFNDIHDLDGLNFVEVDGSAHRLAWNTLADYDLDFDIVKVVNSFHEAIKMVEQEDSLYTFVNKSMSYRCQYTYDVISKQTQHIISALNVKNDTSIDKFLNYASHRAQKLTEKYGFEHI